MVKVFGIGNILLCDDAIGVKLAESLQEKILSIDEDIKVIIGETDYLYCIENINKEDTVIIIDSTYLQREAGSVSVYTLEECDKFIGNIQSQHEENLIKVLRSEQRDIKGYMIGIEIDKVDYSLELSQVLSEKFEDIRIQVFDTIKFIYNEIKN